MSNQTSAPSYAGRADAQATGHAQPLSRTRAIAAITIGNGLEFYDFVVYSFFATLIGQEGVLCVRSCVACLSWRVAL